MTRGFHVVTCDKRKNTKLTVLPITERCKFSEAITNTPATFPSLSNTQQIAMATYVGTDNNLQTNVKLHNR